LVMPEKKEIGLSFPLFTAIIVAITFLVFVIHSATACLVYDRRGIAAGQVWRLFTGNLVHFSLSHLFFNLIVFALAGWAIESRGYPGFRLFCILSAGLTGATLYILSPDMAQYGGLSGIACGAVVYLALYGLCERGTWKYLCAGALLLTACKILLEYRLGEFLFVNSADAAFVPVPLGHAVGSMTALASFLFAKGARWIAANNCHDCVAGKIETMEPKEEGR
jgi:rhomboid family GlyGly-CTERM serine protease